MEAPDLIRMRLTVQYDGSEFHGWQIQPDQRTVQGELEAALGRLADSPRTVLGSGRTDTGVHATGQVASVDMPGHWTPERLSRSLNALLPDAIWVADVSATSPDFHPRYDAVARSYTYRLGLARDARSPFARGTCWVMDDPLDATLLQNAADVVVGAHSFEAFAKAGQPERGYDCTVSAALWSEWDLGFRFDVTADRYLHHMVRYLVGTMVDIARGRRPLEDMPRLLAGEAGLTTSPPAPPQGLFLARVEYPPVDHSGMTPETNPRSPTPE